MLKMDQQQTHEAQYHKQDEAQGGEDLVAPLRPLRVLVKGGEQDDVLVGQHDQDAKEETNRKGRGKPLQDERSQDAQRQMYQTSPDGGNYQSNRTVIGLLQCNHCWGCSGPQE